MEFLYVLLGIIFLGAGFLIMKNPERTLEYRDRYRIEGPRTYTGFAKVEIIVSGVFIILCGLALVVLPFVLHLIIE